MPQEKIVDQNQEAPVELIMPSIIDWLHDFPPLQANLGKV